MGTMAWTMDGARPDGYRPAPLLGQDTRSVLTELLDVSESELGRLENDGVLG